MSDSQRTTVTRRRVLSTSLAGLLATGAASALPTAPVAAEGFLPSTVVIDPAELAAECARLAAESRRTGRISADLHGEAWEEALWDHVRATLALYVAELARHFPGFAPAIVAVWEHVQQMGEYDLHPAGACCADGPETGW